MLWTALILGAAGSLHCAGMCGPIALALPAGAPGRARFVAGRLSYNLGRIGTYAVLGAAAGAFGQSLALAGVQRWVSLTAGVVLLVSPWLVWRGAANRFVARGSAWLRAAFAGVLRRPSPAAFAVLGLVNGLLPCGLVYAAAAGAAAAGTLAGGTAYMLLFGAGTLPVMLGLSLSGRAFPAAWRLRLSAAVPAVVCVVGGLLVLRGLALGIPWLSPGATGACPHCPP